MSRKSVLSFLIVASAATLGLYLSRGPWLAYKQQREKATTANRDLEQSVDNLRDLQIEKARRETFQGREESARKVGYLKPREERVDAGTSH